MVLIRLLRVVNGGTFCVAKGRLGLHLRELLIAHGRADLPLTTLSLVANLPLGFLRTTLFEIELSIYNFAWRSLPFSRHCRALTRLLDFLA